VGTRNAAQAGRRRVHAVCRVGDNADLRVDFDATAWFEAATDANIEALLRIGCAGDKEADAVARWVARHGHDVELQQLLKQCDQAGKSARLTFDVKISRADADGWVRQHRPELAARLAEEGLLSR